MTLGNNLAQLREAKGLSQEELAERLSVSAQTVGLWETGGAEPTIEQLLLFKEAFGVQIDDLLCATQAASPINPDSLDTICAALAYAMGVEAPHCAADRNEKLSRYIDEVFGGERADRIVMYNPDAIAQWISQKYPGYLAQTRQYTDQEIYLSTVMPSVTPVCFGTMYTGAQPHVHGIQKYEKPVITIDTIFDRLIAAGKRVALITYGGCSLGQIYLKRNMDYYHFDRGGIEAVNAKAMEVILRDEHDFIVIYNGNYDKIMHKSGPESASALAELRVNDHVFGMISNLIKAHWGHHNTLVGFAMDHGCHEIDGGCGSHGLDMPEDLNIVHFYKGYARNDRK